jgi:hypothetical protein
MRLAPLVLSTGMGGAGNGSAIEGRRQARPMKLGIKQRHPLAVPAAAGAEGATHLLTAHGCGVGLIAELVNRGLATLTHEQVQNWRQASRGGARANYGERARRSRG